MTSKTIEISGLVWQVHGAYEFEKFFQALELILPNDARLYFEGTSISKDVAQYFDSRRLQPNDQIKKATIFPKPSFYHLPFTREVIDELCKLSQHHAQPELFEHFKAYLNNTVLLAAFDFGGDEEPMFVSHQIPEKNIQTFAQAVGCFYRSIYI